jgi:mitochondrial fission protein ELM1
MDASDGRNPFAAVLGWADRIVVTADSVNMISEACSSAAPVRVAGLEKAGGRIRLFLDSLLARGRIQPIDQHAWAAGGMPLQETSRVAALVRERLNLG